jgi:hypothetical protein
MTAHFEAHGTCKNSANAAYGVAMLNANIVNRESRGEKLPGMGEKLRETGAFSTRKTWVNYDRSFSIHHVSAPIHSPNQHLTPHLRHFRRKNSPESAKRS